MITYKDYFEILEEIRIEKNVSVEALCEGVISPRTYYRHLKESKTIKMDVFTRLMNKFDLDLSNITLYGIHFRKEDTGVIRFIFRTQMKSYHDMDPIYERILKLKQDDTLSSLSLRSFILKYEYETGKISKDEYEEEINIIVQKIKDLPINNIYLASIYLSLLEIKPENEYITINELADLIKEMDFRINSFEYFISLERVLFIFINNNIITPKYKEFLTHANLIFSHFYIRDVLMNYALFKAYEYKIDNDINQMESELYKYIINSSYIYGGKRIEEVIKNLKNNFNVDYKGLLVKNIKLKINSSHINLI